MLAVPLFKASSAAVVAPPTGPPTSVYAYTYAGTLLGVGWTNGDVTASTEVSSSTTLGGTKTVVYTSPAGATEYETGNTSAPTPFWWVRHVKAAQYSAYAGGVHG